MPPKNPINRNQVENLTVVFEKIAVRVNLDIYYVLYVIVVCKSKYSVYCWKCEGNNVPYFYILNGAFSKSRREVSDVKQAAQPITAQEIRGLGIVGISRF